MTMPNVLLFHGFGVGPESLRKTVDAMEQNGFRVTAPSMVSFSIKEEDFFDPGKCVIEAEYALLRFMEKSSCPFYLAGHSLGGTICAHLLTGRLTQKLREKVRGCAFLATPAGIDGNFLQFWQGVASQEVSWPFAVQVKMFSFLRQSDELYENIMLPAVVVQGGRDRHIPPQSASTICSKIAGNCLGLITHAEADHFFVNGHGEAEIFLQQKLIEFLIDYEAK